MINKEKNKEKTLHFEKIKKNKNFKKKGENEKGTLFGFLHDVENFIKQYFVFLFNFSESCLLIHLSFEVAGSFKTQIQSLWTVTFSFRLDL